MQSDFFVKIKKLIASHDLLISSHGYDELAEDGLTVKEILLGVDNAIVLEEYPDFPKGECCLVLQKDHYGNPVHVVWGIAKNTHSPAVLITAYRPDPKKWSEDFKRRRK